MIKEKGMEKIELIKIYSECGFLDLLIYPHQKVEDVVAPWVDKSIIKTRELKYTLIPPGMYANRRLGSDCYPFEIIGRRGKCTYLVRAMNYRLDPTWKPETVIGGFVGHTTNNYSQEWIIEADEQGQLIELRYNQKKRAFCNAQFKLQSHPIKFYDFNF